MEGQRRSSISASVVPFERPRGRGTNQVFKSGPLYISSKGLGWKSWKRRWFILTRTSLVFFKNDPNVVPAKTNEVNLTLGGIDLNNSGSVLVRAEKKLLTVLFPDGRAFTLKAETSEDLDDWRLALERALAAAPDAALVMGHNGIFRNDSIDAMDGSVDMVREQRPVKSLVVGRPILLALEDIDGSPSFLEKALCFIERYGLRVEGILRQSADVDDVERRVRDYEQGRKQFAPNEDAHVVGDCIKHVLRELPSSPVPTPCCTALLEAHRLEGREARVSAMRLAVADTFPDPNRRLLQRILRMMQAVAAHTAENRMSASAVAACMAPLLLRPLLAGECGLDDESDISGDNAAQLLAATAAANNAQSIVTTLLEDYQDVFEDYQPIQAPPSPMIYEAQGLESDESEGDVIHLNEEGYHDDQNDLDAEGEDDHDRILSGTLSESSGNMGGYLFDYKLYEAANSELESPSASGPSTTKSAKSSHKGWPKSRKHSEDRSSPVARLENEVYAHSRTSWADTNSAGSSPRVSSTSEPGPGTNFTLLKAHNSTSSTNRAASWGMSTIGNKIMPSEPHDSSGEEEHAIHRLEVTRNDLQQKIAREVKGNSILQASLERRKQALHDRRVALEQDVARLQEQLQAERDLRAALEIGLTSSQLLTSHNLDPKTQADVEEIAGVESDVARLKQKVSELHLQLNQQRTHGDSSDNLQRMKSLQAQQKILQKELDLTLILCHQERLKNDDLEENGQNESSTLELMLAQQRHALAEAKEALKAEKIRGQEFRRRAPNQQHDGGAGGDWKTLRPPPGPSSSGRQFSWRQKGEGLESGDGKQNGASTDVPNGMNGGEEVGSASIAIGKKPSYDVEVSQMRGIHRQPVASAALVELTSRLDFFKERRSQLMEQLHNLDPTLAPHALSAHDLLHGTSPLMSP